MASVSVVIPAFNEAAIIQQSLRDLWDFMVGLSSEYDWELVVVDDGSSDSTADLAESFAATHDNVIVIRHPSNFQLGQALRTAFNRCRGDYVVTLDSDLSYSPDHIGRMLDTIRQTRAKVVIASPYMKGGKTTAVPAIRRWVSKAANRFLSLTAKGHLSTLTGMARAYDRVFLSSLNLKAMDIEINTEIIYKAQLLRAKIVEIPAHLDWSSQQPGEGVDQEGRRSSIRFGRSIAAYIFSGFMFRPFMFFILPGLVLLGLSLYTLGWAVAHTWSAYADLSAAGTATFSRAVGAAFDDFPHTFLVGGISLIISVQLVSLGILSVQNKRYFEELFHLGTSIYRRAAPESSSSSRSDGAGE
jgi:glycosyltransferase involved in cell wall biosynthesis